MNQSFNRHYFWYFEENLTTQMNRPLVFGTFATIIWTYDNGNGVYFSASINKGFGIRSM